MKQQQEFLNGRVSICAYLGVGKDAFYSLVAEGLPVRKIGGVWRAHPAALADFFRPSPEPEKTEPEKTETGPLFGAVSRKWLSDVRASVSPSTHGIYGSVLERHVLPFLAHRKTDGITREDVGDVLMGVRRRGLSASYMRIAGVVISGTMKAAVGEGLAASNPVPGVVGRLRVGRDGKKTATPPMTEAECRLFLKTCLTTYPEHHPLFLCAFGTGMRIGELIALGWPDVDWENNLIRVERTFGDRTTGPFMTRHARPVDMADKVRDALRLLAADSVEGNPVFHKDGAHLSRDRVRGWFGKVLEKAGMGDFRFGDVRHTFASLLSAKGVGETYIREQLGHGKGRMPPGTGERHVNLLDL